MYCGMEVVGSNGVDRVIALPVSVENSLRNQEGASPFEDRRFCGSIQTRADFSLSLLSRSVDVFLERVMFRIIEDISIRYSIFRKDALLRSTAILL